MPAGKLALLLTTSPEQENTHTVLRLAEAALSQGHAVDLFLMCDGVLSAGDPRFDALVQRGAQVAFCELSAEQRKLHGEGLSAAPGSQYLFSTFVDGCDRFVSFT